MVKIKVILCITCFILLIRSTLVICFLCFLQIRPATFPIIRKKLIHLFLNNYFVEENI